jgi:hypothetical protein
VNLEAINNRVDAALKANRRAEFIVIVMALCVFFLGAGILFVAYWYANPYIGGGTFLLQSFLYWPIREILKVRKDNLVLQTLPVLVAELPPKEAILQIRKLAEYVRATK